MADFGKVTGGLIAVIGDEDTVTGFLLCGVGHRDKKIGTNFMVVDPEKTSKDKVAEFFKELVQRKDIALILINQHIAESIRHVVAAHKAILPAILEVPSKEHPYDEAKDPMMLRVKRLLGGIDDS